LDCKGRAYRSRVKQEIRFCTAADGTKLAYATSGEGSPLVMAATWLTHLEHQWRSLAWKPWLEELSSRYTLLRYDSRGCGLSDRSLGEVTFETWLSDFETVIEAAGFERFDLVGTCWGGPIVMEYARRHPERVRRMVLYGTYARGRYKRSDMPEEPARANVLLELTRLGWGRENHEFTQIWANSFQPGGTLEHQRSWCEQQQHATSAENAIRLLPISWQLDMTQTARSIAVPTLVLHVERDRIVPIEEARHLAGLIPGSRFVQLDSENHMPIAGEPAWQRLREELRSFLGNGAGGTRAPARALSLADLTEREREVLEYIARGLDNSEIAAALSLSEKTVRNHITRVFDKIGVAHRYQAIVLARDAGLGTAAPA
jgi:pimeloyl-ACP methyl ester carboxylesterase/DNA-binding CsgD family transcriptional regulator